ncbi:MAG TPA: PilN domain-containing protein [Selenomonadales bacterium]|nr:PilN domain-containing protein [Selenomonadales bacterium]
MIRINLLPAGERRPEIPYARVALAAVMAVVLLLGCAFAAVSARAWLTERDLAAARTRYEELRPVREAMEQAGDKQKRIDAKLALVKGLTKLRTYPYRIPPRIAALMPETLWLDETKVNQDTARSIELKGGTAAYPDLAQFISRLEGDGAFAAVTLKATEGDLKAGTLKFTLELKLKELQGP